MHGRCQSHNLDFWRASRDAQDLAIYDDVIADDRHRCHLLLNAKTATDPSFVRPQRRMNFAQDDELQDGVGDESPTPDYLTFCDPTLSAARLGWGTHSCSDSPAGIRAKRGTAWTASPTSCRRRRRTRRRSRPRPSFVRRLGPLPRLRRRKDRTARRHWPCRAPRPAYGWPG